MDRSELLMAGSFPMENLRANPFATEAPKFYDQQGNYRGKLNANPFDQDSTSNQFGRSGWLFLSDSMNNQFGAGRLYLRRWMR